MAEELWTDVGEISPSPSQTAAMEPAHPAMTHAPRGCRFCGEPLTESFADLGVSPLCQTHITAERFSEPEPFYPLHAFVCGGCFLVQIDEFVAPPEIFEEYAYFSSYSDTWVEHARRYCERMRSDLGLDASSLVAEIASNDGYLLQHFVAQGVPVLGIEPAANVALVAIEKGVRSETVFFGRDTALELAAKYGKPDLLLGNNVLAHVPDINSFVEGMQRFLADAGVVTMEFPHLLRLMDAHQFDTIYHEHFSYLSLMTVERVFAAHGLRVFDVEELPTHGGSIRIHACHARNAARENTARLAALRDVERARGLDTLEAYRAFQQQVVATKRDILDALIRLKRAGKTIAGYGAPGKGNTLLNYCGIRTDILDFTVDRNPYKQGKFTPGTRIPIRDPEELRVARPDYVFILPWNLRDEIIEQTSHIRDWGGRWIVPIPRVEIVE